ncbi:MFS transporter [Curtobacterium flaccumfaciens]|nr:MFS transporter [Curtobacterium flaccumfaciens]
MMITQGVFAVLSALLAVLTLAGVVEAWHIWVIAFLVGMVTVIDNPARQVFVTEIVGHKHLRNAISVNSSVFQLGGMIGPALSGALLVAVGAGWSFGVNAIACVAVVVTLGFLKVSELHRTPPAPRGKGQLVEGLRYAVNKPTIIVPVILVAFFSVFALTMPVLLSAFASQVYDVGAGGYRGVQLRRRDRRPGRRAAVHPAGGRAAPHHRRRGVLDGRAARRVGVDPRDRTRSPSRSWPWGCRSCCSRPRRTRSCSCRRTWRSAAG